jgi:hypothetical protein
VNKRFNLHVLRPMILAAAISSTYGSVWANEQISLSEPAVKTSVANLAFATNIGEDGRLVPGKEQGQGHKIVVRLSRPLTATEGMLAVCIGDLDLSQKTVKLDEVTYLVDLAGVSVPGGTQILALHLVTAGRWIDLANLKVIGEQVSQDSASKPFEAKFSVGVKGQISEKVSGTAKVGARPRFQDATMGIALSAQPPWLGKDSRIAMNLLSVSRRNEALNFGVNADAASKLDMQDYRADLVLGTFKLTVGHQSVGAHPLILADKTSRGVTGALRLGERFDVSASAIRATSVIGFDDFIGLQNADHRIYTLGVGFEAFPETKGMLRTELTLMDGKAEPQSQFNRGQIEDAERSKGVGLKVSTSDADSRWRGDVLWARSKHVNPIDQTLAQGGDVVAVKPENRQAYTADFSYLVLKDAKLFGDKFPMNIRGIVRYEYSDPLFKSLGANFIADQRLMRYGTELRLGELTLNLTAGRKNDNVSTIPTVLKTGTYDWVFSMATPLASIFAVSPKEGDSSVANKPINFWPSVQWDSSTVRQYTLRIPDGTNAKSSFWPDQRNRQHKIGLNWSLDRATVGYSVEFAHQDNRQTDRTLADFLIRTHQVTSSYRATDKLSFSLGLNQSRNLSVEKHQTTTNTGGQLGIDWAMTDDWSVKLDYSSGIVRDSLNQQYNNAQNSSFQAVRKLPSNLLGLKVEGQGFVRATHSNVKALDNTVLQVFSAKRFLLQTGLTLNY